MSPQSRLMAGIVLIIVPTVEIGGASILSLLIADPSYAQNDLRQDLWRAGHAHAGVWLVLSLVALRYVDEATLSENMRWVVRVAFPAAAILMPLAFFLSVLSPEATEPNAIDLPRLHCRHRAGSGIVGAGGRSYPGSPDAARGVRADGPRSPYALPPTKGMPWPTVMRPRNVPNLGGHLPDPTRCCPWYVRCGC